MKTKNLKVKLDGEFMIIDDVLHSIISRHSFDDYAQTLETFEVMNYAGDLREICSRDEGETFYEE